MDQHDQEAIKKYREQADRDRIARLEQQRPSKEPNSIGWPGMIAAGTITVILVVFLATFAGNHGFPQPPAEDDGSHYTPDYTIVGGHKHIRFVFLEPAYTGTYELGRVAKEICGTELRCKVMFWDRLDMTPGALPISAEQSDAMSADYVRNKWTYTNRLRVFR